MSELVFDCVGASADRYAVVPSMVLRLKVTDPDAGRVEAIALRCQIRIEPHRRRYSAGEAERLTDLFGDTDRWAETLKPLQLVTLSAMVPGFTGSTIVELSLPCSYDLEIASTKYFSALEDGVIPLLMLFSGTVFISRDGRLQVRQVSWSSETSYQLPVKVFREMVDLHFPNSAWFRVRRETMDALQRFKSRHALPTWDSALTALLDRSKEKDAPC
jgi:hypothetical protein